MMSACMCITNYHSSLKYIFECYHSIKTLNICGRIGLVQRDVIIFIPSGHKKYMTIYITHSYSNTHGRIETWDTLKNYILLFNELFSGYSRLDLLKGRGTYQHINAYSPHFLHGTPPPPRFYTTISVGLWAHNPTF